MVEALTAAATAGVAMKYVLPAIRDLGEKVLEASEDSVSNAVVGFGKRLLLVLLGRRAQADQSTPEVVALRKGIERRVLAVARDPAQQKAASQLEAAIEDLLMADSKCAGLDRGAARKGASGDRVAGGPVKLHRW
jgi:hypothetical protein